MQIWKEIKFATKEGPGEVVLVVFLFGLVVGSWLF